MMIVKDCNRSKSYKGKWSESNLHISIDNLCRTIKVSLSRAPHQEINDNRYKRVEGLNFS